MTGKRKSTTTTRVKGESKFGANEGEREDESKQGSKDEGKGMMEEALKSKDSKFS